jgi:hypothetical protein
MPPPAVLLRRTFLRVAAPPTQPRQLVKENEDAHRQVVAVGEQQAEVMDAAAGLHLDNARGQPLRQGGQRLPRSDTGC